MTKNKEYTVNLQGLIYIPEQLISEAGSKENHEIENVVSNCQKKYFGSLNLLSKNLGN